jgi:uncharacterized protein
MAGDAFDRAFADPADRRQALRALKARLAVLQDQIDPGATLDNPDALRLEPLMAAAPETGAGEASYGSTEGAGEVTPVLASPPSPPPPPDAPEDDLPPLGMGWAEGFLAATADAAGHPSRQGLEALPADDPERVMHDEAMAQLHALTWPADDPRLPGHLARWHEGRPVDRDAMVDLACLAVQDLRLWWVDRVPAPATRRAAHTPGRNDPCPCGSGRKFKKCHGAG